MLQAKNSETGHRKQQAKYHHSIVKAAMKKNPTNSHNRIAPCHKCIYKKRICLHALCSLESTCSVHSNSMSKSPQKKRE